jgi:hypothetical protein
MMGFLLPFVVFVTAFFLQTDNTSLPVMLDKILCDAEVLVTAVCPGPLLAHVIIPLLSLINGIKDLFHGHNYSARY